MQNNLVEYVGGKSQTQRVLRILRTPQKCLFFLSLIRGLLYFYWTFSIGGKYDLGGISKLRVISIWEHIWIFHIPYHPNESLAGSHACPRASNARRVKEIWLSSPGLVYKFYFGNYGMYWLPFSDQRYFKRTKYREQKKLTRSHWKSLLGHRKIIATYNKCKRLE